MGTIYEIAHNTPIPDVTMQSALREIDTGQLALAMLRSDELDRDIVFRNMSKRAAKLLQEEISAIDENAPPYRITQASALFEQKLRKYARHYSADEKSVASQRYKLAKRSVDPDGASGELPDLEVPVFDDTDMETILESFRDLKVYLHAKGALALEGADEKTGNPLARKALRLLVDGWDPMVMRVILERTLESYLARKRRELEMILEGFDCLASSEHMIGIEERLKAHMA